MHGAVKLFVYALMAETIIVITAIIVRAGGFVVDTLGSLVIHGNVGLLVGTVFLNGLELLGLGLVAMIVSYQFLQTFSAQGAQTNDDNVMGYIIGVFSITLPILLVNFFYKDSRKTAKRLKLMNNT